MASPTAAPDAPREPGSASLKSWSRAPHFPHDYETRTALPPRRDAETPAYLAHLRTAVAQHRDRINEELTARMEEDKKREAAAAAAAGGGEEPTDAVGGPPPKGSNKNNNNKRKAAAATLDQEALEEQNYGEEVVEED